jgi:hypothetical protein
MKRPSHGRKTHRPRPTPDQLLQHIQAFADQHHHEWQLELTDQAPNWTYLLGLHLRLVELEQLTPATGELL